MTVPAPAAPAVRLVRHPITGAAVALAAAQLGMGLFGVAFWSIAARTMPAGDVGIASAFTATLGFVLALAGAGLPETLVRHVPDAQDPRALVRAATLVTAATGLAAAVVVGLVTPGRAFADLASTEVLSVLLVLPLLAWAISSAALLATGGMSWILGSSLASGLAKVVAVVIVAVAGMRGAAPILIAYAAGGWAAALVGFAGLRGRLRGAVEPRGGTIEPPGHGGEPHAHGAATLWRLRGYAAANVAASGASLLPLAIAPSLLVARAGADAAAYAAVPLLLLALLTLAPSVITRGLFAEGSRHPERADHLAQRSMLAALACEAVIAAGMFAVGPLALEVVLGPVYAAEGGDLLRLLACASVIAVPSYVADALLNIRRDRAGFALVNVGGSIAIIAALYVFAWSPTGLGIAWCAGQAGYLALATTVLAVRHLQARRYAARQGLPIDPSHGAIADS